MEDQKSHTEITMGPIRYHIWKEKTATLTVCINCGCIRVESLRRDFRYIINGRSTSLKPKCQKRAVMSLQAW
jgi:hypothetical protein